MPTLNKEAGLQDAHMLLSINDKHPLQRASDALALTRRSCRERPTQTKRCAAVHSPLRGMIYASAAKAVNPDGGTPLRTCNYRAGDCARTHASAASGEERTSEVYEDNYTR